MSFVQLTSGTFDELVQDSEVPVLVDFYAEWCAPCKMLKGTLELIDTEYSDRVKMYVVDVTEEVVLASRFAIQNVPSVIIFKNGKVHSRLVGARSKSDFEDALDDVLVEDI